MRSYKHIAPCPICRQNQPDCGGHDPVEWQCQHLRERMELNARKRDDSPRADRPRRRFKLTPPPYPYTPRRRKTAG